MRGVGVREGVGGGRGKSKEGDERGGGEGREQGYLVACIE